MGSKTKKTCKWIVVALLCPVLLFLLLTILIYLPPVQNWLVGQVTSYASEKTGMQISVDHVNLDFPLDLGIDGFRMIQGQDTIADVEHMTVDVELLPLLRKRVVIDELEITNTKVNTSDLVATARIKGQLERLFLTSRGIDLDRQTIDLNGAVLDGARVDIALIDTVIPDTSTTKTLWKIYADSLTINQSQVALHLPGDTLSLDAWLGHAAAYTGEIDLGQERYSVGRFVVNDGKLKYDQNYEPSIDGFDYNHIALDGLQIDVDSIWYQEPRLNLNVRQMAMRDKSGLEITELTGPFSMDATSISLPHAKLRTLDSDVEAEFEMDTNAFDSMNPGALRLRLNAQLGKQDLLRFVGGLPQQVQQRWPNYPLSIRGSVNGNMESADFSGLIVDLPTAFSLKADGTAAHLNDLKRLQADVLLHAKTENLGFLSAYMPSSSSFRLPPMTVDGRVKANASRYDADLTVREGSGVVKAEGYVNTAGNMQYQADLKIQNLNVHDFLPKDSIYTVTADVTLDGSGTDFFHPGSRLDASANISQLHYGHWHLSDVAADAVLRNGRAQANITSHNELADGTINLDALLSTQKLDATVSAELNHIDLQALRLTDNVMEVGFCGHLDVTSDLKYNHRVQGFISELDIRDEKHIYRPTEILVDALAGRDTTWAHLSSGDVSMNLSASGSYETLLDQISKLSDEVKDQLKERVIDQPKLLSMLPTMHVDVRSGTDNPLMTFLRKNGINYKQLFVDITTSPESGLNGNGYVYSLVADSNRIDTLDFRVITRAEGQGRRISERHVSFNIHAQNNKRNPQLVFNAMLDGAIHQKGAVVGLRFFDAKNRLGIRLGANAELLETGINLHLVPERPTIGYKEFNLNSDNFVFLGRNNHIKAKVNLIADDGTGVKVYSDDDSSEYQQDLTISLNKLNLDELTSVLPYSLPNMGGLLNGDFHVVQNEQGRFSMVSDFAVQNMRYEESMLGNISTELVYLEKGDNAHVIEARIMKDEEEVGLLSGTYYNGEEGRMDATFSMQRFPLNMINGFIPGGLVGLEGFGEGKLALKGTLSHPQVDGEVYLDSSYLVSDIYGIRMRFDNDPVRIVGSHLLLENFSLYAYNDNPLTIMGDIDFSDLDNMSMNIRMRARDFQLINAKKNMRSEAYGKAFVNFFGMLKGPLDDLDFRGRLDVLGSTDLSYILRDSPLTTDNQLNELVKFTDFSDTTQTVISRPQISGFNMNLTIDVSQGAHVKAYLNADQSNYVDLMGGGTLRMTYNPTENLRMTGKYTLNNGEMKYSLPVIPLKTFTIQNGSYIEFTGDVMNPTLNIRATERVKASVSDEGGASRSVDFDCGVIITKTLNDMGLEFTLDAPQDMILHSELQSMGIEQRGKLAVSMLTTGMYLDDGNVNAFNMNSALSSFLSSEINNITGNALRTLDLSIGLDNTTDASGAMHTDYSFKFAKRFWNNRLRVIVGGKVSTHNDELYERNNSFLDNVMLEYRLDNTANKYVTLFYQNNSFDWLEGYTQLYGAGFIWRRSLNSLGDIFRFKTETPRVPRTIEPADTTNVKAHE